MRLSKLALGLCLSLAAPSLPAFAADVEQECLAMRDVLRNSGVEVELVVKAVDLFDATQTSDHTLTMHLYPEVPNKPCMFDGDSHGINAQFLLGGGLTIRTATATYAGIIERGRTSFQTHQLSRPYRAFRGVNAGAYHAVLAALMRELGFETFEHASGDSFGRLLALDVGELPRSTLGFDVLGVGSKGGRLYQLNIKQYSISSP